MKEIERAIWLIVLFIGIFGSYCYSKSYIDFKMIRVMKSVKDSPARAINITNKADKSVDRYDLIQNMVKTDTVVVRGDERFPVYTIGYLKSPAGQKGK